MGQGQARWQGDLAFCTPHSNELVGTREMQPIRRRLLLQVLRGAMLLLLRLIGTHYSFSSHTSESRLSFCADTSAAIFLNSCVKSLLITKCNDDFCSGCGMLTRLSDA